MAFRDDAESGSTSTANSAFVATDFSPNKKRFVVLVGLICVWNANLGSSLPTGAVDQIASHFSISNTYELVLLNSLFLLGYALGPLVFGPLSEYRGRRPVLVGTYLGYTLFTIASALSPNYGCLLFFRLVAGIFGSAPNVMVGSMYADIYDDPSQRGSAIAYFIAVASMGAPIGPLISGFAGTVSWNLSFWIAVAIAGVCLPCVLLLPETYAPALKRRGSMGLGGKENDIGCSEQTQQEIMSPSVTITSELKEVFAKPFMVLFHEPLVFFSALYLALVYAILYLFFQAYPIIFEDMYGMTPQYTGVAFLPLVAGCIATIGIFEGYNTISTKAQRQSAAWALDKERSRLTLACAGAPILVLSLFWLGWTSSPSISPIVPMMSGVCFGMGFLMIFMAMLNYIGDAYRQFSAPAFAGMSTTRSIFASCLPFAAKPMYTSLGVPWACSLLGFLTLIMALIPFIFIRYGKTLRAKSPFCQKLESN
ncbi:major facilitator superfamily domain-containing protein [Xylariales sp. PMI_506]|nr:major facilitator superfamily domain-containing protein [Xylariales sp. PMI_506]